MGRPRAFDAERALDRALDVFWRKGFEGASLPDLTRAMGINRPSLYAAFGNKEELFRKVLERYVDGPAHYVREAYAAPTAREVAQRLLFGAAELLTAPGRPRGCLVVQGALACGQEADGVRKELEARRAQSELELRRRFERARVERDLPAGADPARLSQYVWTVIWGMAVKAAGGGTRDELRAVAEVALQAFPAAARASRRPPRG
ncbi:MAG: TetR/AcrR family transcriptional regulator [Planctomycetota bacterium]|nr:TetR/AcrR family transcriptional regulator [Planctomycetota bacterium]